MPSNGSTAAYKPILNLALLELRKIHSSIPIVLKKGMGSVDPYTKAHLIKIRDQINKALDAQYICNVKDFPKPSVNGSSLAASRI